MGQEQRVKPIAFLRDIFFQYMPLVRLNEIIAEDTAVRIESQRPAHLHRYHQRLFGNDLVSPEDSFFVNYQAGAEIDQVKQPDVIDGGSERGGQEYRGRK